MQQLGEVVVKVKGYLSYLLSIVVKLTKGYLFLVI